MVDLPQRRAFATREDFAAAVSAVHAELWEQYQSEPVSSYVPDWVYGNCHSVGLPLSIANEGGAEHGVASIVKQAIELKMQSIGRLVRVERDGIWRVFFEGK